MMDNEITIIDGQEYSDGQEAIVSKKIKVNDEKMRAIVSHKQIEERKEATLKEIEPIVEEPEVKEEPVAFDEPEFVKNTDVEKEEPVMKFAFSREGAYQARETEDEISKAQEDRIRDLGDAYKGQPKPEFKKVIDEKPVEEKKEVTTEMFIQALNHPCYSDKTSQYKESFAKRYKQINDRLEAQIDETKRIMAMYMEATETGAKLLITQNEAKRNIDGINALQLDFLMDNKDEESIKVLRDLEDLFNKNKEIIISTTAKIKENDQRKAEIGENEQASKTKASQIEKERAEYEEREYDKLVEANERDARVHEAENGLTEFTGIADDEVKAASQRETVTNISSMESPAMNKFESLREQPIVEEPKTVIGVNQFMNGESYDDMSFGRRAL